MLLSVHDLRLSSAELLYCQLVSGASFEARPREVLALVGEHGSGKSAILSAIAGTFKGYVLGGDIRLGGQSVAGRPTSKIAYSPRYAADCFPPSAHIRKYWKDLGEEAPELPPEISLKTPFCKLSALARARAALALAVRKKPRVLLVDTPFAEGLSAEDEKSLHLDLKQMAESGMAIVYAASDIHSVENFARRLIVLYAGEIVEQGPVGKVFRHPLHPYTQSYLEGATGGNAESKIYMPQSCRYSPLCKLRLHEAGSTCFVQEAPCCTFDDREVRCHLWV
jgi:ABC-type dipeptide/oligopeptide/nickel transport system ATPase component